jgi:hypothetical protein
MIRRAMIVLQIEQAQQQFETLRSSTKPEHVGARRLVAARLAVLRKQLRDHDELARLAYRQHAHVPAKITWRQAVGDVLLGGVLVAFAVTFLLAVLDAL